STGAAPDTTPPLISNGQPSGIIPMGTAQVSLSVATDEAATCRYGPADAAYAALPSVFTSTGGTSHSTLVSVQDGQPYTYYVRCQDGANNSDAASTVINFYVAGRPGT